MKFVARGRMSDSPSHGLMPRGRAVLLSQTPHGRTFTWEQSGTITHFHLHLPHCHFLVGYSRSGTNFQPTMLVAMGSVRPMTDLDHPVFALPVPNVYTSNGYACTALTGFFPDEVGVVSATLDRFFQGIGCKNFIEPHIQRLVLDPSTIPTLQYLPSLFLTLGHRSPAIWEKLPANLRLSNIFTPDSE